MSNSSQLVRMHMEEAHRISECIFCKCRGCNHDRDGKWQDIMKTPKLLILWTELSPIGKTVCLIDDNTDDLSCEQIIFNSLSNSPFSFIICSGLMGTAGY
jgi:hypothetical protein